MRNISFSLTTEQIKDRSKTVTRRKGGASGWRKLKPGDLLCACKKCMGLKPGEKIERLATIRVKKVTFENLSDILPPVRTWEEGVDECYREGFPKTLPEDFVKMFVKHMGGNARQEVIRIEFEYT